MNLLDILLLIPVLYGLYSGFKKGIIYQLTGLVGVIVALLFSFKLSAVITKFLLNHGIIQEEWSSAIGFTLTFVGIFLGVRLVGYIVRRTTRAVGLGFVERLLGAALGGLKIFLIVLALMYLFLLINNEIEILPQDTIDNSIVYQNFKVYFDYILGFFRPNNT